MSEAENLAGEEGGVKQAEDGGDHYPDESPFLEGSGDAEALE